MKIIEDMLKEAEQDILKKIDRLFVLDDIRKRTNEVGYKSERIEKLLKSAKKECLQCVDRISILEDILNKVDEDN